MDNNASSSLGPQTATKEHCLCFRFVICAVFIGTVCLLGLAGNMTSFIVLWKHTNETAITFLLRCLAVTDSLLLVMSVLVYSIPAIQSYVQTPRHGTDDSNVTKSEQYSWPFAMMAHTCTIWLVVLVTWNRYCATCRLVCQGRTQVWQVRFQACIVIFLSVLYNVPRFFEHDSLAGQRRAADNSSSANLGDNKTYQVIYSNILYFPVMYIVPLLSLTFLNTKLIKNIKAIKKVRETLTGHRLPEDHITVCVIVLVFVFILTQTPALINQIFWATTSPTDRLCGHFHFYYTTVSDFLVVLNSSGNFIIYCLFGKSFRKIFVDNLCLRNILHRNKPRAVTMAGSRLI